MSNSSVAIKYAKEAVINDYANKPTSNLRIELVFDNGFGGTFYIGKYSLKVFKMTKDIGDEAPYSYTHPFPYLAHVLFPSSIEEKVAICKFITENKERIKREYGLVIEVQERGQVWLKYEYSNEATILNLDTDKHATKEDIVSAFRELSLKYHPDRILNATNAEIKEAEEKFKEIRTAYEKLMKIDFENVAPHFSVIDLKQKRLYELYESYLIEEKNNRIASLTF